MLDYLLSWPLGTGETIGLLAFLSGVVAFLWRLAYRVMRKLDDLSDSVQGVAEDGKARGDDHAVQMTALTRRVTTLETQLASRASAEASIVRGQENLTNQVTALGGRLDAFLTALLKMKDR